MQLIRKLTKAEIIGLMIFLIILYIFTLGSLRIVKANTHSDQDGYYLIIKSNRLTINKSDYVAICIPDEQHAQIARTLGLPKGKCRFNTSGLLKHIVAINNDIVSITPLGVNVNNKLLPNSSDFDVKKDRLLPHHLHQVRLKANEFIVLGTNPLSFDSRYFGVVKRVDIIGKAYLLWKI